MRSIGSIWQATLSGMGLLEAAARARARIRRQGASNMQALRAEPCQRQSALRGRHGLQGVGHVHRQAARHDEDGIEALLVLAVGRVAADPELGGPGDAAGLERGDRGLRLAARRPPLDLDEGKPPAAHRDEIDLAVGRAHAATQDAISLASKAAAASHSDSRPRR